MSEHPKGSNDPETDPTVARSTLDFPVVGIGTSAGGISALRRFFGGMPSETGMAFVVVLHLSPTHASNLGEILQRETRMTVLQVNARVRIEADHIYVIPPSKELSMSDGHLGISDLERPEGRHTAIDLFFRSLAQMHRERSVGIVLSGTGSDGTQGLKRIKETGGVAIAQSPEDAEYDAMPRSAIATGLVDFVLPISEMPQKLIELWKNASRIELPDPPSNLIAIEPPALAAHERAEEALMAVKALLLARTGHDFTHYKRATVLRRLERRMQVAAVPTLYDYAAFLEATPSETRELLQDMLISVTNFFRDREAFETLERELMARPRSSAQAVGFRAWAVGCATGEEAYSLGIVLSELMDTRADVDAEAFQIFASDIDQRAIDVGRVGVYPESIITDVPPSRLRQFFTSENGQFRIVKAVRDRILFSAHNALRDPPFTRLDLVCCRNLLIYLDRRAQQQLLETFHYALNPGGLLFLGGAETTDAANDLFTAIDKKNRLFRANAVARSSRSLPIPAAVAPVRVASVMTDPRRQVADTHPLASLHARIGGIHAPATVLIDANYDILHVDERAAHLLRMPGGAPSRDVLRLVREDLRVELRTALFKAADSDTSVEARRVTVVVNGRPVIVTMNVHPARDDSAGRCFLVVFNESVISMTPDPSAGTDAPDPVVSTLEAEVTRLKEQLAGTLGESATSTEELRASNEELQTINEELRSATEELETSKEELQSVNEELTTVNGELVAKVDETARVNDDLQNLISSTEIGSIFIDRGLRIKRYTPPATRIFNIIATDTGRHLLDLTSRLDYPELAADVDETLRTLRPTEREVAGSDGRFYLARVLPYRTGEDRIIGAVLNFIDITDRRKAEDRLNASERRMRMVADNMNEFAIMTFDTEGMITTWSKGAATLFGHDEAEALGRHTRMIFTEEDRSDGIPERELQFARETGRASDDRWHVRKNGTTFFCSGVMTSLVEKGTLQGFAKIARDLTEARNSETMREAALDAEQALTKQLERASALKDEFLAVMSHELKNPLNLIQINAEMLLRAPALRDIAIVQRLATSISKTVTSQAQIIDDLLDLSRVNTGKLAMRPVAVDLNALVAGLAEALQAGADKKNQRLTLDLATDVVGYADPTRVEQILWNLVSNAVKFSGQGQTITVSLAKDGDSAILAVMDAGVGVPSDMLAQVFEMFQQVDRGFTRSHGGLGIGLALVKRLAEMQGGSVSAFSEGSGRGSRFSVRIPLFGAPTLGSDVRSIGNLIFDGLRILWVDDDAVALELFKELLILEGASVTGATDAGSALAAARRQTFDVIISDIAMPGRDGYDLIAELRAQSGTGDAIAIAVTGFGRKDDIDRAVAAGFDAHLAKPLDIGTLASTIRHVRRK